MIALSHVLLRPLLQIGPDESAPVRVRRAKQLVDQARTIAPDTRSVLDAQAEMLRVNGRWDEAKSAYQQLLNRYPEDRHLNNQVALCYIALGRSEEALPLLRKAISVGFDDPGVFVSEINLGNALIRLGQDGEAVEWLRRGKQEAPVVGAFDTRFLPRHMLIWRSDEARRELEAFTAMEPWVTLRWLRHRRRPTDAAAAEAAREIDGLAKAGLRDHAEEEGDTGVDSELGLRPHDYMSPTPLAAPGVITITTAVLSVMLAQDSPDRPVVLATT